MNSAIRTDWREVLWATGKFFLISVLMALMVITGRAIREIEVLWIEPPASQEQKWHPELFKTLTFGQLPAAIDWLWLRTLQDEGIAHVQPGVHPRGFYDLDLATDLDPGFFELYVSGGHILAIIRDDDEGSLKLLEKGMRFFQEELPNYPASFKERFWGRAWELPLLLAYVHLFEFNDMPKAAEAFRAAAELEGAPTYLQSLRDRLNRSGGEYEVGLRLLNFMIEGARSDYMVKNLEEKRESLLLAQYLFHLNENFRAYLRRLPEYRSSQEITPAQMSRFWSRYKDEHRVPDRDPWGGTISIDPSGRIVTTTPYEPVFGLE